MSEELTMSEIEFVVSLVLFCGIGVVFGWIFCLIRHGPPSNWRKG